MKFADLKILMYLAWLVPAMIFFYLWANIRKRTLIKKFAQKELIEKILPFYKKRRMFFLSSLRIFSVAFILLALARPQWGFFWEENKFKGFDILIALDTSKSMLARDVYPDRLQLSKERIKDFVNGLRNDRVGLIAFSGQAFLQCPLTVDYGGLLLVLKAVNTGAIPRGGTSISDAIEEAIRSYKDSAIGEKLLLLITDGENTSGDVDKAIEAAKDNGLIISCIGIGSYEGSEIAIVNDKGQQEIVKDKEGNIVKAKLDEKLLKKVAGETGGIYVRATPDEFGLWEAYEDLSGKLKQGTVTDNIAKVYEDRFQLFAALAFLFLMIELLMRSSSGKRNGRL